MHPYSHPNVREYVRTTGTGSIVLQGAVPGFRRVSQQYQTNDTFHYRIDHLSANEYEEGTATFTDPNTIARASITASSNGGSAVNFSAGEKVFTAIPRLIAPTYSGDPSGLFTGEVVNSNGTPKMYDGSSLVTMSGGGLTEEMANYAILQHTESTNTNGGASSGGVQTRKLNNVAYDGIGITLSGNEFTFTNGGTYRITAKAACNAFGGHRLIVQDTNSSYNVLGLSGNNYEPSETVRDVDNSYAHITTPPITIAADDTYRLDHYAVSDSATDSFGYPCGDGNDEIYAEVVIERLS